MPTLDLERIFRKQMASYAACDVDGLLLSFTDDCVLRDMADPAHPFTGKDEIRGFLTGYFADLRNVAVTISNVAVGETVVIGELDVTADYVSAPYSVAEPHPIRLRYCIAEEIRDGLVANERFYWDSAALNGQLRQATDA